LSTSQINGLLAIERDHTQSQIDKYALGRISDKLGSLTPLEHLLIGSTCPGLIYQPNQPLQINNGVELYIVNYYRFFQTHRFILCINDNFLFLDSLLLPVSIYDINHEEPVQTFLIFEAYDIENHQVQIPDNVWELILDKYDDKIEETANYLTRT